MPPTPQQSFTHIAPQVSPPHPSSGMPSFSQPYNMSFESPQHSQTQPLPTYNNSFNNGPVSNPGYSRSFGEYGGTRPGFLDKPQIYTAVYSGVTVYEMEVAGVACMRRRDDGWLNATQILKVAGIDKGKRTKVLEKEILTGDHEKVQGGYGKYQGTWISYKRGREFCRQYGVEDVLRALLDHEISADGSGRQSQDTPTKEQAMAANRKKFYNTGVDSRTHGGAMSNGTFFSNISPTSSVALAAMNKAARLNSPAPRPAGNIRRPSLQDAIPGGSQQSVHSDGSFMDTGHDSGHHAALNGEPARKRMRRDSREGMGPPALPLDVSMQSAHSTDPNESFWDDAGAGLDRGDEGCAQPPLPAPETDEQHGKMNLILDLFADSGRVDYASHKALTQLSGDELNMPLDASANNALHWAATLAKTSLLKLLIRKGANIRRGNAAGQSPLISAVLVSNCWEHSCFPDVLDLLYPLIELRDLQGRTVLHHIAVSSGIKGRAPSSKYYLEALLEFLVRMGNNTGNSNDNASLLTAAAAAAKAAGLNGSSQDSNPKDTVTLLRFLSHVVNARDKAGNTALNLVARIGNRSIIQQLLEIGADSNLQNHKGVSAKDFGVPIDQTFTTVNTDDSQQTILAGSQELALASSQTTNNAVEELSEDVITSLTSMLTQSMSSHKDLLKERTEQIDRLNEQIQDFSSRQRSDLDQLQELKERVKVKEERRVRIANLKRSILERRQRQQPRAATDPVDRTISQNSALLSSDAVTAAQRNLIQHQLPNSAELRARLQAYTHHNTNLQNEADELKSRSIELEGLYRKVVSLCTGVAEDRVADCLPGLLAAVESERGSMDEGSLGKVRDFLRKIDGGGGSGGGGGGVVAA